MVELIVKRYVPFVGVYESKGVDTKGRLSIPNDLVETLKERQLEQEKTLLRLYYKMVEGDDLFEGQQDPIKALEFTDFFPLDTAANEFPFYNRLSIGNESRVYLGKNDNLTFTAKSPLIFVGRGNAFIAAEKETTREHLDNLL
jgi:DNA-binding transcriptional regulator/RsmH inhibitor MraZ|tara:strand:- start:111 stop:539 length:429 start_codon:yes stop_codon:yes gene_type:complete